jgi:putative membrane protein
MKAGFAVLISICLLAITACLIAPAHAQELSLSAAGKLFLKEASSVDMMEVQLGKVAHDKGSSQEVKDFGDRMALDHGKANEELRAIATRDNLRLPVQVERKHTLMIARLSKLSGHEFDRNYMKETIKNGIKNIARYKKAIKRVKDQDLKAWTVNALPVLQQHLQLAQAVAQKLGPH